MWRYNNRTDFDIPEGAVGFVYEIRRNNLIDNIKKPYLYIGKKQLFGKGKNNKGTESNWREYWGSSAYLEEDLQGMGHENFERHILQFCYSYSELNWEELRYQMELGVLSANEFSPMVKKYYNYNVVNKLYTDRYFDNDDASRRDPYIAKDQRRPYPLYLTDGVESYCLLGGIYDIPGVLQSFPNCHIGSTPDTEIQMYESDRVDHTYHYQMDEDFSIYSSFKPYEKIIISNGKSQRLFNESATIPEGFIQGAIKPERVEYENIILAINIDTYETENVSETLFKEGPYVKVGTKPIEVREGKKNIIFRGYAKKFIQEFDYELKETWITRVLKKKRTGSWHDLTPTYTKKAKEVNPQLFVKKLAKI
jgi:hypothetical protein